MNELTKALKSKYPDNGLCAPSTMNYHQSSAIRIERVANGFIIRADGPGCVVIKELSELLPIVKDFFKDESSK